MACDPIQHKFSRPELDELRATLKSIGFDISGDVGDAHYRDCVFHYDYDEKTLDLTITCIHKPFFIPCSTINGEVEKEIRNFLSMDQGELNALYPTKPVND